MQSIFLVTDAYTLPSLSLRMDSDSFMEWIVGSELESDATDGVKIMMYFLPLKIFLRLRSQAWSAISTIRSLRPDSTEVSCTYPNVSPMIAISMFINTTAIMNVARRNMHIAA